MSDTTKEKPDEGRIQADPPQLIQKLGSIQKQPQRQERWKNLNSSLNQALSNWNDIVESCEGKKSPDEERLEEVKGLLQNLKTKLDEF